MTAVVRSLEAVDPAKIIDRVSWLPRGAATDDSRTAEKFVVRGYKELFDEIDRLAVLQLRSKNSECVMAIMDSIDGRVRSTAALDALCKFVDRHMGIGFSTDIFDAVPLFELSKCRFEDKFVIRFPEDVRGVMLQCASEESEAMVTWVRKTLLYWINNQRRQHALLATAVTINEAIEAAKE